MYNPLYINERYQIIGEIYVLEDFQQIYP